MADDTLALFEQRLRSLVSEKTEGGENYTDIARIDVEKIGDDLGLSPRQANEQFFALRGRVWQVESMSYSKITSGEPKPPPRDWLGINDVYLIG